MQIKVNANDWNGISDEDRKAIKEILSKTFKNEADIVADPQTQSVAQSGGAGTNLDGICTSLCNMAQSAAESLCNKIGNATAKQVCLIAAATAGDLCRSKC
ncbi:hypothetical protein [Methylobacterium planeticum]|uniref:Uncharacterized protein n=1 Tax=Methylobacterium planeticum TaxID=2615211 RepID=A0A6N6MWM9_9HYPH|nr:hypothetical protein [Methylobacterium planeticum]KAB1076081.1 hypothetical protein F6X51_00630 [Methylobacterium planeticum]